jgi:hypothetical protein
MQYSTLIMHQETREKKIAKVLRQCERKGRDQPPSIPAKEEFVFLSFVFFFGE